MSESLFTFSHTDERQPSAPQMTSKEVSNTWQNGHVLDIKLRYRRSRDELPRHLPSSEEILSATSIPTNKAAVSSEAGSVVVIDNCLVVKYGDQIWENEGYALLLLENYPSIPSPKL